jgi:hypothetical protein
MSENIGQAPNKVLRGRFEPPENGAFVICSFPSEIFQCQQHLQASGTFFFLQIVET